MARRKKSAAPAEAQPDRNRFTVQLDDDLNDRFAKAAKVVGVDRSTLARIGLEAVANLIERGGRISIPLRIQESGAKDDAL